MGGQQDEEAEPESGDEGEVLSRLRFIPACAAQRSPIRHRVASWTNGARAKSGNAAHVQTIKLTQVQHPAGSGG
jgi:hypothetical protein